MREKRWKRRRDTGKVTDRQRQTKTDRETDAETEREERQTGRDRVSERQELATVRGVARKTRGGQGGFDSGEADRKVGTKEAERVEGRNGERD